MLTVRTPRGLKAQHKHQVELEIHEIETESMENLRQHRASRPCKCGRKVAGRQHHMQREILGVTPEGIWSGKLVVAEVKALMRTIKPSASLKVPNSRLDAIRAAAPSAGPTKIPTPKITSESSLGSSKTKPSTPLSTANHNFPMIAKVTIPYQ